MTPRVLGVDDWALKKGQTYGTILVDLEARRVVDLLPDRTAQTLAEWLREHDTVEVIARDRSTEYARGASLGAPQAIQVADRWHLLQNLHQMVGRWLAGIHGRLRGSATGSGRGSCRHGAPGLIRAAAPKPRTAADFRARRLAQYEEVRRRFGAGEKLLAISRATGLARVRCGASPMPRAFPSVPGGCRWPSMLDPYLDHLEARVADGCENAAALWREIKELGFAGSAKQVRRWLSRAAHPLRRRPRRASGVPIDRKLASDPVHDPAPVLLSPRQLAWLLVQVAGSSRCTGNGRRWPGLHRIPRLAASVPWSARLAESGAQLRHWSRQSSGQPAEPFSRSWLDEAASCGVPARRDLRAGLAAG